MSYTPQTAVETTAFVTTTPLANGVTFTASVVDVVFF